MYRLYLKTKQHLLETFEALIEPHVTTLSFVEIEDKNAAWDSEDWYIEGFSEHAMDEAFLKQLIEETCVQENLPLPEFHVTPFEDKNWLEDMWKSSPPQHVGSFFIYGDGYEGEIPTDSIPIHLHAATAFGSGEHGTTAGCMLAIEEAYGAKPWTAPLDLGCGSGILSVVMAKLHPIVVTAIDIDSEAIKVTDENALKNNVAHLIKTHEEDGLSADGETFDFIVANILAKPLIDLAPLMRARLAPKGRVILSGLLDWQEEDVLETYLHQGFSLKEKKNINRWITLVLEGG